jgi:hypothetical protein
MWDLALKGDRQGTWFWIAIYTFLICAYSVIIQIRIRNWSNTKGELKHMGVDKFGASSILSEQDYRADALYTYQVEGKTYHGKRISPWIIIASHNAQFVLKRQLSKIETFADKKIKVFYKPSNPKKSWLILPSKFGVLMTVIISLLPAFSYWLEFYS